MLLSAERGSFAVAGTVAAIYALSNAVIGPQVSRLIDSFGQSRVVPIQLLVHVPALLGMIAITLWTSLTWPVFLLAFVAGASQPIVGPLVRARWSVQLHGSSLLRTAFAWESLVDEAVFILGPPLVTIVALQINPSAGLLLATSCCWSAPCCCSRSGPPSRSRPAGTRRPRASRRSCCPGWRRSRPCS